jgi:hypothetical protein
MTPSDQSSAILFEPGAITQRIAVLAHTVTGHLGRTAHEQPGARFDVHAVARLLAVANAWVRAEHLATKDFRERFFDADTGDATAEALRAAIIRAAKAKSPADLSGAATDLASIMTTIGLARWHELLSSLASKAAAKPA